MGKMIDMDLRAIEAGLAALCAQGALGGSGSSLRHVQLLGSGYETDAYAFSLFGSDSDLEDCVLRLYAGSDTAEKCVREFDVMRRVHAAGFPIPRVLCFEGAASIFGRPYIIMERIHGSAMEWTYWSPDSTLPPTKRYLLFQLLAKLHSLDPARVLPDHPLAHLQDPYGAIDSEIQELADRRDLLARAMPMSLGHILDWLVAARVRVPCDRLCVVHGDFHPNNVLISADGSPSVIDWSNAKIGDRRRDIAWTRLITMAETHPDRGAADTTCYERAAGIQVENLEVFEVVACMRLLLSTLISLRHDPDREGLNHVAERQTREGRELTRYAVETLREITGIDAADSARAVDELIHTD